ncbi:MAG: DNA polymerase [Candidatus Nanopelagicaceae bacterium]
MLKTISVGENMIAQYTSPETFPKTCGIYDLGQFLMGLSLFQDPGLNFDNDEFVTIRGGRRSAKYYFSDPEITLKSAPERDVKFPGADMEFSLSSEDLVQLQKASGVYGLPDLSFVSTEGGTIALNLCDKENATANAYTQEIQGTATGEYELFLKVENLKLYPGDYDVKVSSKLITEWKHQQLDLVYYIALEP